MRSAINDPSKPLEIQVRYIFGVRTDEYRVISWKVSGVNVHGKDLTKQEAMGIVFRNRGEEALLRAMVGIVGYEDNSFDF